ncbi:LLM class flavin-dependent oxidoreductase [Deinococcus soli (ex Cha et al. 2016)]|uniref:LLM class flavin-dependent oxidoreductase n=1 Tax=Deinococcus soli (ex Cha et al. 2016) TaxID=1309411 RepID=UPI00166BC604|nr:LLM class flavin-dependent oxidoreductase [Deinococcus soli (ex Cha et al. 2016)]GGB56061.1 methanesulfonate monooxygenase [Deinococcus soli (ex Cha et al. 2016)]
MTHTDLTDHTRPTPPSLYWFIPSGGDGRQLGQPSRPAHFSYLSQVAQAADVLGFDGVLLPTGGTNEDTLVVASALSSLTRQLRFLVALRPGLLSPVLAARLTASLDRISGGRVNLNIVSGSGNFDFEGLNLTQAQRYALTGEWLGAFRALLRGETVSQQGEHVQLENARALLPSVQRPYPPIYFGGSSQPALEVAGEHVDVYLSWGERPEQLREKFDQVRAEAARHGRQVRFGLRAHVIVRPTEDEAWAAAEHLIEGVSDEQIAQAHQAFLQSASEGQRRQSELNGGTRESLRVGKNLWAGVGLVRGGAGTAFVGSPENVAAALREYQALGVETFILSGYPHLEEAYRVAELLFPALGRTSPVFTPRDGQPLTHTSTPSAHGPSTHAPALRAAEPILADAAPSDIGRFRSI